MGQPRLCYVDVGGTFTDAFIVDDDGDWMLGKAPSTPHDASQGFLAAIEAATSLRNRSLDETLSALLGGHVDVALSSPDEAVALVEAGTIRQLGQFSRTRTPMAPSIPSMAELGYKIYMEGIKGLMAPKGTPKPVIRKLHDGFHKTMEDPGFKSAVAKLRLEMAYLNEEDYGEALRSMYGQIGASLKK